jgi:hypothetical protein
LMNISQCWLAISFYTDRLFWMDPPWIIHGSPRVYDSPNVFWTDGFPMISQTIVRQRNIMSYRHTQRNPICCFRTSELPSCSVNYTIW